MRVFYKHRGIEKRFEGMRAADGVLLAERTEGVASVAHALAYCQAIERMAGVQPPWAAALIRVLHAELERLACHLDVIVRLADGAGLAVATARFGWHKEMVLRLTGQLSGSRFGRGVVVPGGVSGGHAAEPADVLAAARGAGQADRRRHQAADGYSVIPGPAARNGAACAAAGERARGARADRTGVGLRRRRPAVCGLTRPTDPSGHDGRLAPGRRRAGAASRSASTRSRQLPPAAAGG